MFQPKLKDNEIHTTMSEDSQIDFKCNRLAYQFKFKPTLLSVHTDFGQFHSKFDLKNETFNFWNNPYALLEISKSLKVNSLFLGNLFHINKCTRNNVS